VHKVAQPQPKDLTQRGKGSKGAKESNKALLLYLLRLCFLRVYFGCAQRKFASKINANGANFGVRSTQQKVTTHY
jgi:hypothetical protein